MARIRFILILILMTGRSVAQQDFFMLIQSDHDKPFYARVGEKTFSSSERGFLIISQLRDTVYHIYIGFSATQRNEMAFTVTLPKSDLELQLKDLGDKGWGLLNPKTMELRTPDTMEIRHTETVYVQGAKRDDAFSRMMAAVVGDTAVMYSSYGTEVNTAGAVAPADIAQAAAGAPSTSTPTAGNPSGSATDTSSTANTVSAGANNASTGTSAGSTGAPAVSSPVAVPVVATAAAGSAVNPASSNPASASPDAGRAAADSTKAAINRDSSTLYRPNPGAGDSARLNRTTATGTGADSPLYRPVAGSTDSALYRTTAAAHDGHDSAGTRKLLAGGDSAALRQPLTGIDTATLIRQTTAGDSPVLYRPIPAAKDSLATNLAAKDPGAKDSLTRTILSKDSIQGSLPVDSIKKGTPVDSLKRTIPVDSLKKSGTNDSLVGANAGNKAKDSLMVGELKVPATTTSATTTPATTTPETTVPATSAPLTPAPLTPAPPVIAPAAPAVQKISERKTAKTLRMTYLDNSSAGGKTDTVDVIIPISNEPQPTFHQHPEPAGRLTGTGDSTKETQRPVPAETPKAEEPLYRPKTDTNTKKVNKIVLVNSDCKNFASDYDVDKLRVRMLEENTEDDKIAAARKIFKTKCFTTKQIRALSEVFTSDAFKFRFFESAYPFVSDDHFKDLSDLLADPVYNAKFKAMVGIK